MYQQFNQIKEEIVLLTAENNMLILSYSITITPVPSETRKENNNNNV